MSAYEQNGPSPDQLGFCFDILSWSLHPCIMKKLYVSLKKNKNVFGLHADIYVGSYLYFTYLPLAIVVHGYEPAYVTARDSCEKF